MLPSLIARYFPWSAAAQAGVQLARLGLEYKKDRDRLKATRVSKDVDRLEARLQTMEERFDRQSHVLQELASNLEKEIGRLRKGLVYSLLTAGGAFLGALFAILLILV